MIGVTTFKLQIYKSILSKSSVCEVSLVCLIVAPTIYLLIGKNTKRINAVEIELEKQLGSTK